MGRPSWSGLGENESFVASDIPGILAHTRDVVFLADREMAVITPQKVEITTLDGTPVSLKPQRITWDPIMAEKGGFKHFMLKEIHEQPRAVRDTTLARISRDTGKVFLEEMKISEEEFRKLEHVRILACGTSWHAALAGKFMIESLARLPVEVDYGSEYRYRDPVVPQNTLAVVMTQSGETADTLAAQREIKEKGAPILPSAMLSEAWSRAKRTEYFTPMLARKSALPPPKALLRSSPPYICWPCSWRMRAQTLTHEQMQDTSKT